MEKEKSLTLNTVFYLIYNVLNVAFPFATGIYVAHILFSGDIGRVEAARNFSSYFVILSFLGIPTYGLREVAKARKDKEALSKVYSELMIINAISTIIFSSIYISLIFIIPQYRGDLTLYLLAGLLVVLNLFNNSWLFEGLEKFGFISFRNLIFKITSFICLVLLVRTKNDFLWYLVITIIGTAGNYSLNMISSPRYAKFRFKNINLKRHLKPIMFLTMVNLAIEIYSLVDITMLNLMCSKEIVAYYSYGMKIFKILIQIVNTFTIVLVPRIALYHKEGKIDEFNKLVSKTFLIILMIALPSTMGIWFTSDYLIPFVYGEEYLASSMVLKILSLILLISPFGYLLGSRMLLIVGRESKMLIPVGAGALMNIIANFILIRFFNEIGAAVASVIGEITVMLIYVLLGKQYYLLVNIKKSIWKVMIAATIMFGYLLGISFVPFPKYLVTILQVFGAITIYGVVLICVKETIVIEFVKNVLDKIRIKRPKK